MTRQQREKLMENRLGMAETDTGTNMKNVVVSEIGLTDLPPYLSNLMSYMVSECTDGGYPTNLKFYSYTSDYNRQKGAASYMIDATPLKEVKAKNCAYQPLCASGTCAVMGYAPIAKDVWTQAFHNMVFEWGFTKGSDQKEKTYNLAFKTLSSDCAMGDVVEDVCQTSYIWKDKGLVPVQKQ